MNITPLQNYVMIEEIQEESKSGIYIPQNANLQTERPAKVISVGKGISLPIKRGDKVLFKAHGFDEIVVGLIDKKRYLIGKDEYIVALVK